MCIHADDSERMKVSVSETDYLSEIISNFEKIAESLNT